MANFIAIVDSQRLRRERFCLDVKPLLPPVPGLAIESCHSGDCEVIRACNPAAPVSCLADADGVSLLLGIALDAGGGGGRIEAKGLREAWRNIAAAVPPPYEGYHAALAYSPQGGIVLGADPLGVFPLYWWTDNEVALFASSPALFKYHPSFRLTLDPRGLAGMLLTGSLVDGHTLLAGVSRLSAGHLLTWRPGEAAVERQQYALPISTRYFDLPFSAHLALLDEALDDAVRRQAPQGGEYAWLASGGRDTRTLAGYLQRNGAKPVALTMGRADDYEMRCARRMVSELGLPHRLMEISPQDYAANAKLQARWEQGADGFNNVWAWQIHPRLSSLAPSVLTAFLGDAIIGGTHLNMMDDYPRPMSFDIFLSRFNAYGVRIDMLRRLLRPAVFRHALEEVVESLRRRYSGYAENETQRAWGLHMAHRQRYHVGGMMWKLSFGAWPIQPLADMRVLGAVAGMPCASLAERRLQDELLRSRFPRLAELPIDRNSPVTTPLSPRLRYLASQALLRRLAPLRRLARIDGNGLAERRHYFRLYDFDGTGWQTVRTVAEPGRQLAGGILDSRVLDELLPSPGTKLSAADGIKDASGLKSLLGFLLWLMENRDAVA